MAWPEVGERPTVLLPVGSTEQHGPHLPFSTDAIVAEAVARGVAAQLNDDGTQVVVAPTLAFGASGEHQHFPGTVSMGHEALRFVLIELVRSLSTWAGGIVIVNGHGGNVPTLGSAVPQLIAEQHRVAWLPCVAEPAVVARLGITPDAHAGRIETSLMLHLRPSDVRLPLPVAGSTAPMRELLPLLETGGVRAVSPSGILGDPRGSTAAEGAVLLDAMISAATARIRAAAPDPRGML